MKISELLNEFSEGYLGTANSEITDIVYDSSKAVSGSAFVCLAGAKADGHDYAMSAYENGCRCFVCERDIKLPDDAEKILVSDTRKALAIMSAAYFKHPLRKMKIIGVTGTKGKTTVTSFIYNILNNSGIKTGMIGTNGVDFDENHYKTANTTPESYELHRLFSMMLDFDVKCAVIEVSSQAYKLDRVYGINFDIGIFTNLYEDHIGPGEHADIDEYIDCKAKLFENSNISIINVDDVIGQRMLDASRGDTITYSIDHVSDNRATEITAYRDANKLCTKFSCQSEDYSIVMPGKFNVYNALAAICACKCLGVDYGRISEHISNVSIKGRFELVDALLDVSFIIDYAHNGASLTNLLQTVKSYSPRRLVCLFGSVGERTQIRRRELAKAASEFSDFCILTSDNPGREEPNEIISEIASYMTISNYVCIADREEAIHYAVENSIPGDVIVLAGKGHEDYQLIGRDKIPFSEKEIILEAIKEKQKAGF